MVPFKIGKTELLTLCVLYYYVLARIAYLMLHRVQTFLNLLAEPLCFQFKVLPHVNNIKKKIPLHFTTRNTADVFFKCIFLVSLSSKNSTLDEGNNKRFFFFVLLFFQVNDPLSFSILLSHLAVTSQQIHLFHSTIFEVSPNADLLFVLLRLLSCIFLDHPLTLAKLIQLRWL